jgi:hypothetical protein
MNSKLFNFIRDTVYVKRRCQSYQEYYRNISRFEVKNNYIIYVPCVMYKCWIFCGVNYPVELYSELQEFVSIL